jgi:hypothetical protein
MEKFKETCWYTALGVSGGVASLAALTRCTGGNCTSCIGCAGVGLIVLMIPFCRRYLKKEEGTDGKIHGMD